MHRRAGCPFHKNCRKIDCQIRCTAAYSDLQIDRLPVLDALGNKGCTVVLIEITAEIRVIASTTVIRRVTAPIHLIKGMTAIIGVFGWRTSGFVVIPFIR